MVRNQNVLRLQVPVVDPDGMAELDGIQDLQESMFGELVVAHKPAMFSDVREQVAFGAELHYNERAVRALEDAQQGHDIGMLARLIVKSNFPSLEAPLPGVQTSLGEGFHGIWDVGESVDGLVDHSISANS